MLRFFRKIRQQLLSENRFSKYLLYAIGEVVLVIIGILIALAINEQTKSKERENLRQAYIIQLNDEVDANIKQLKEVKSASERMAQEIDTVVDLLANKDYQNPQLLSKSPSFYTRYNFNPLTVTYENLKFSGDLKLFEDLHFRNSITKSYNYFNKIAEVEEIDKTVADRLYGEYLVIKVRYLDMTTTPDYGKDLLFENGVITRRGTLRQNADRYTNAIESLEKLKLSIAALEKE
jgi:type II secretory pathway pseudopilin PulG